MAKETKGIDRNHPLYPKFEEIEKALNPDGETTKRVQFWTVFLFGVMTGTNATVESILGPKDPMRGNKDGTD